MRIAGLIAALLVLCCRSVPDDARVEAALDTYRQAMRSGGGADAVVSAELAGIEPPELATAGRAAARRHHERALASSDPDEAVAREEVAHALLARTCAGCAREQIPVLLHLAKLYAERGDAGGLERCAQRARSLDARDLDASRLSDWPLLKQLGELCERVGDFARAASIERSLLEAKLQILDAAHPQVAASRARIAELERRGQLPPVGAPPPDPAQ